MIRNEDQNEDIFLNGWEALAASIILQAAKDYRKCRKKLQKTPDHPEATKMIRDVEKFFRSRWFSVLSNDLNGAEVLDRLKHEDLSPKKKSKAEGGRPESPPITEEQTKKGA